MAIRQTETLFFSFVVVLAFLARSNEAIELVNVACDESVKAKSRCGAGGFFNGQGALSGTFVCRNQFSTLFSSNYQSVCTPTVLNQIIGYENDRCGCCNGVCPEPCGCVCNAEEDKVLVMKKRYLFGDQYECVSRGKASRWVSDGSSNYSCVAAEECPALPPPAESSTEEETKETPETPEEETSKPATPEPTPRPTTSPTPSPTPETTPASSPDSTQGSTP